MMFRTLVAPRIVNPVYCAVLASPKNINHKTPFVALLIGSPN